MPDTYVSLQIEQSATEFSGRMIRGTWRVIRQHLFAETRSKVKNQHRFATLVILSLKFCACFVDRNVFNVFCYSRGEISLFINNKIEVSSHPKGMSSSRAALTWPFVARKAIVRRARYASTAGLGIKTLIDECTSARGSPVALVYLQLLHGSRTPIACGVLDSRLRQRCTRRTTLLLLVKGTLNTKVEASVAYRSEDLLGLRSGRAAKILGYPPRCAMYQAVSLCLSPRYVRSQHEPSIERCKAQTIRGSRWWCLH